MRRLRRKNPTKIGARKLVTGILVGGMVGATVGWLTAPASVSEMIRRLRGDAMSPRDAQERAKTAEGNIESQVRELAEEVKNNKKIPHR